MDLLREPVSRRQLVGGAAAAAAAGGAAIGYGSLPAWARPVVEAASTRIRHPDSLPFPKRRAGTPDPAMKEIEHIIVLIMENHSFDNILGMAAAQIPGRKHSDGLHLHRGRPLNWNPDASGRRVYARRASSPCQVDSHPNQDWNASHESWNHGLNNGFVKACTDVAMWYWDKHDLPFTYSLAEHFPYGERYFCSVMAQTFPNRRFFFCGTSSGLTATDLEQSVLAKAANGTIFERLDQHRISWRDYAQDPGSATPKIVPNFYTPFSNTLKIRPMTEFYADAKHGRLPQFSFLDPNYGTTSEENPQDIQVGERFLADVVHAVTHSPQWEKTALLITWDEHGGYYDHVPPPRAIKPDNIAPIPGGVPGGADDTLLPGGFDRYGFRVPMFVISPWAKRNYISRIVQDHTSMDAFIERKWNLPAMTYRDANAHPMLDYFDFRKPGFMRPPKLAPAPGLAAGHALCKATGLTWPT